MRKTLGVCLLALLLTGSASAGIMQNGVTSTPPPPQTNSAQEPTDDPAPGEIATPGVMGNDAPDILTQTALDLLAVLPSLL